MNRTILAVVACCQLCFSGIWEDTGKTFDERTADLLSRMTVAEKINQLSTYAPAISRFGMKAFANPLETLHGIVWFNNGIPGATCFPLAIGLAASWDPDTVFAMADAVSDEVRAWDNTRGTGYSCLSPVVDMARDPRWGRTGESYGEDPFLTSQIGFGFFSGMQGTHPKYIKVASTAKHFACNSEELIRLTGGATVDERSLREYYLPAFKAVLIDARSQFVMCGFNRVNDTPAMVHKTLLASIMKKEWGYKGCVMSDGGGYYFLRNTQRWGTNDAAVVAECIKAGCDIDLVENAFGQYLQSSLNAGYITIADVDSALARFIRVRLRTGEFDPGPAVPWRTIPVSVFNSQAHHDLSRKIALKTIVLLKNRNATLPLQAGSLQSVAVIGPYGDTVNFGAYSPSATYKISVLQGLRTRLGSGVTVSFVRGCNDEGATVDSAAVATAARGAGAVVLCIGYDIGKHSNISGGICGGENYDRSSIELPAVQTKLAQIAFRANRNTVAVFFNSEPLAFPWINDSIPAIVEAWQPGPEQGTAVAGVLFGDFNPGGKLPMTFYASTSQLPSLHEYNITRGLTYKYFTSTPQYPFGHGLSYTTFEYSNLVIAPKIIGRGDSAAITFTVRNTGTRAGDEVVQVYVHDSVASVVRPIKELVAFKRIYLLPGESKTVTLKFPVDALAFWDVSTKKFIVEPGDFSVMVGSSSADIRLRGSVYATNVPVGARTPRAAGVSAFQQVRIRHRKAGEAVISFLSTNAGASSRAMMTVYDYSGRVVCQKEADASGTVIFRTGKSAPRSGAYLVKVTSSGSLYMSSFIFP